MVTVKTLERKLDKVFSKYIRERDSLGAGYGVCATCGKMASISELDCGHFIKRQHRSVRWDERNAAAQCRRCNHFMGGRQDDFAIYIIERYGVETLDELMELKYQAKKHTRDELLGLIKFYEEKIK